MNKADIKLRNSVRELDVDSINVENEWWDEISQNENEVPERDAVYGYDENDDSY